MKYFILCLVFLLTLPAAGFSEPVREKGISMQMLPSRAARLENLPSGFWVDFADYLQPETKQPILQTPVEFIAYVKKQNPEVQANGVWVTLFNRAAYTEEENAVLEKVKSACRKSDLLLFICPAKGMPGVCKQQ